jgi:3-methylcrotonyl-CoA carboxylase alpha subunit
MIAKLIVWGADRAQALARMAQALAEFQIVGLATNIAFLKRLVEGDAFASADLDTGLIERNADTLFPQPKAAPVGALALAAITLIEAEKASSAGVSANPADPWGNARGWRLNSAYQRQLAFSDEHTTYNVTITYDHEGWHLAIGGMALPMSVTARGGTELSIKLGETSMHAAVLRDGDSFHVFTGGRHFTLKWADPMAHVGESDAAGGRLTAPMPGKVVAVIATKGQQVKKGAPLVIMEAMKMEHTISAPGDGTVEDVLYQVGDQVADGAPLLAFKAA